MMNAGGAGTLQGAQTTSFAIDLAKWNTIMEAYLERRPCLSRDHADRRAARVPQSDDGDQGDRLRQACATAQWEQGNAVRAMLAARGVKSVAAEGFGAPGVVVSFTDDPEVQTGKKFAAEGLQIAAGVPLMVDEGPDYKSFRLGLFGLDKLKDVPASLARLEAAFDRVL